MGTGLVNGATSAKGSGQLTAQPDAASGSGRTAGEWPTSDGGAGDGTAGDWRPGELQRQRTRDRVADQGRGVDAWVPGPRGSAVD